MGYFARGEIDSSLRYTPPPKTEFVKTGLSVPYGYSMVTVQAYMMMYGPDGKTLVAKKPVGFRVWVIQRAPGVPRTTVNTAIRYVLETRKKTLDPVIRQNADQTLAKLLALH